MRISYDATASRPVADVWTSLTDVDRILSALPGASLTRSGTAASGSVRCRLRVGQVTYRVVARADLAAIAEHTAVLAVTGKEARGDGTLAASLTVAVRDGLGGGSTVQVTGDLDATGRAADATAGEWERVVRAYVAAVLATDDPTAEPPAEPAPAAGSAAPPRSRPVAAVPASSAAPTAATGGRTWLVGAAVAVVLALLLGRRARRRSRRTGSAG